MNKSMAGFLIASSITIIGLLTMNAQNEPIQQVSDINTLPEFINDIRIINEESGYYNKAICMEINQEPFWVAIEDASYRAHLVDAFEISIDNSVVSYHIETHLYTEIHSVFNKSGDTVGWYPNPFTLCVDTSEYLVDTHQARISLTSTSGDTFTYSWDFDMDDADMDS